MSGEDSSETQSTRTSKGLVGYIQQQQASFVFADATYNLIEEGFPIFIIDRTDRENLRNRSF